MNADMIFKAEKIAREEFPNVFCIVKTGDDTYKCGWENHEVEVDFDGNAYYAVFHHTEEGMDFCISLIWDGFDDKGELLNPHSIFELKHGALYTELSSGEPDRIYTDIDEVFPPLDINGLVENACADAEALVNEKY